MLRVAACLALGSAVVGVVTVPAHAAVTDPYLGNFVVPTFYGQPNTTYQEWAGFSAPAGPNPATVLSNAFGTPDWRDTTVATDGAFLLGAPPSAAGKPGGHVYSFSGTINLSADVPTPTLTAAAKTTIVLQAETLGSLLDLSSFLATPTAGGAGVAPTVATHAVEGPSGSGFGGNDDYFYVEWDNLPGNVGSYTLTYSPNASSSSQEVLRIDTLTAVPEPATLGLLAVGGGALLTRRRRSGHAATTQHG